MSFNQQVYRVGDFVYAEPKERGMDPSIVNIERLWNNQEGQQMMYGNYYYRPNETYHVTTRRFLEKVSGLIIIWKQKSFWFPVDSSPLLVFQ
jgi:protein polybromo-1